MRKIHLLLLMITLLSYLPYSFAGTLMKALHYKAITDKGSIYDITMTKNMLTYKELSGKNKDKIRTHAIKNLNIANAIEIIQWQSKQTFTTLIIDHENLKFINSGIRRNRSWLEKGRLQRMIG